MRDATSIKLAVREALGKAPYTGKTQGRNIQEHFCRIDAFPSELRDCSLLPRLSACACCVPWRPVTLCARKCASDAQASSHDCRSAPCMHTCTGCIHMRPGSYFGCVVITPTISAQRKRPRRPIRSQWIRITTLCANIELGIRSEECSVPDRSSSIATTTHC